MRRATIKDIAQAAGVSTTAVSFALNDKPGLSAKTRQHIIDTAENLGWAPNQSARSLSHSLAHAVGVVLPRPQSTHSSERFFFHFLVGLQAALTPAKLSLVAHFASNIDEENNIYRSWWGQRSVDGVIVLNPQQHDPRHLLLSHIDMPCVYVGMRIGESSAVLADDTAMMRAIIAHLNEVGAHDIGYICGDPALQHIHKRIESLRQSIPRTSAPPTIVSATHMTEASGYVRTQELITSGHLPQALIYDNELLTLGGYQALKDSDLIPGTDIMLVSCEDSPLCRVVTPSISAINRDPAHLGQSAAQALIDLLHTGKPQVITEPTPHLIARASTLHARDNH